MREAIRGGLPPTSRNGDDCAEPHPDQDEAVFVSPRKGTQQYATFGFSDAANLDAGAMWPTAFALKELTAAEEERIAALVTKAVS